MPRGKRTPPEQKAKAAAMILTGERTAKTSRATGLPDSTVSDIRADLIRNEKSYDYGALVAEYLAENIRGLTAQVRLFGDSGWLREQPAADLAILHGVQADKAINILASWRHPDADDRPERDAIDG